MSFIKKNIPIIVICVFHLVGLVGFIKNPDFFKLLSPVNLLLSVGLILWSSQQKNSQFYSALLFVTFLGFGVEVLGVKSGAIFGSYYYGNSFGFKLFSVPLLIGINWGILLYATAQLSTFKNGFFNALFGAFLMVFLDFFIEQNASKFDFWYWENNVIPFQNYMAWFIISFLFNLIVQKHLSKKKNNAAKAFYFVQLVFFAALFYFV